MPQIVPKGFKYVDLATAASTRKQSRAIEAVFEQRHTEACQQLGEEDVELVVTMKFDFKRSVIVIDGAQFLKEADAALYSPAMVLDAATEQEESDLVGSLLRVNGHSADDSTVAQEIISLTQALKVLTRWFSIKCPTPFKYFKRTAINIITAH